MGNILTPLTCRSEDAAPTSFYLGGDGADSQSAPDGNHRLVVSVSIDDRDPAAAQRLLASLQGAGAMPLSPHKANTQELTTLDWYRTGASDWGGQDHTDWDFDIWRVPKSAYLVLTMRVLSDFDCPNTQLLNKQAWATLFRRVEAYMSASVNPYHNLTHVVDVFVATSVFLNVLRKDPTANFRDVDLCVMLVTALVHDLEHPGTTNSYQVNSGSTLALRYSDISVCEYHHAALTSQMLAQPETAIFANLEPSTQRQIRKTMISLILSTDNTQHFNLKRELEAINSKRDQKQPTASSSDPERDRLTIMKCVLHAADISNPAKPWALARKWSDLILEEFYLQGDKEREKGLEISLNCDRYTVFQDEMSCKFIDIIVFPFFDELCDLLPETFFMIACIKNNRKMWHELLVSRIAKQDPIGNAAQIVSCNEKWTVFASECDTTTKFAEEIVRKKATAP